MNKLYFEKLSAFDRIKEPCSIAIPFPQGEIFDLDNLSVADDNGQVLSQAEATALWKDGSVKWAFVNFFADLPANKGKTYYCKPIKEKMDYDNIKFIHQEKVIVVDAGKITVKLNEKGSIFNSIQSEHIRFEEKNIKGPLLNGKYNAVVESWQIICEGPVTSIIQGKGKHIDKDGNSLLNFIVNLQFFKDKEWFKIDYKILNFEKEESVDIKSLTLDFTKRSINDIKFCIAKSNYKTDFIDGEKSQSLFYEIDAQQLIYEANEHFPEVFYGTFFADWNDGEGGICTTLFQAHQNYPKAFKVDKSGISVQIVPKNSKIEFARGMAKTHTLFVHLHSGKETQQELNIRSLQFQMPDRPYIDMEVYRSAKVFPEIFLDKAEQIPEIEEAFIRRMDTRGKAYGILHWGDVPDMHYTKQGRGNGELVWCNNEYDFPHTAMLMYARTGERRMMDYLLVAARHWFDIDICRATDDEYRMFAQIIHSARHVSGKVEISHEWVEGLFDYYHLTGDKFAYDSAIEIGNNIKKNLKLPRYHKNGEINARETGWALRALVALYNETNDESWLDDAEFIIGHFKSWKEKYGLWLAPYTDHVAIRVPFMIAIAVSSLMRYYEIRPNIEIKNMIIEAVDDMVENCLLSTGLFYYKELPSLKRNGNNTTVLEALAYAYKLTGRTKYLDAGIKTFLKCIRENVGAYDGDKYEKDGAVIVTGKSSKGIAQSFIPVASFYYALVKAGIRIDL